MQKWSQTPQLPQRRRLPSVREDAAKFIASRSVDYEAILEEHLMTVMWLAVNSNGSIPYETAMSWPYWKVASRCRHRTIWLEREEKATEDAIAASRRGR
jgi:hypothetical protein